MLTKLELTQGEIGAITTFISNILENNPGQTELLIIATIGKRLSEHQINMTTEQRGLDAIESANRVMEMISDVALELAAATTNLAN